jgi:hypothetical protein
MTDKMTLQDIGETDMREVKSDASNEKLLKLQRDANLTNTPTKLTFELRIAISGDGPRAYDWQDKPHRLLYDACKEIERLSYFSGNSQKVDMQEPSEREKATKQALEWLWYRMGSLVPKNSLLEVDVKRALAAYAPK